MPVGQQLCLTNAFRLLYAVKQILSYLNDQYYESGYFLIASGHRLYKRCYTNTNIAKYSNNNNSNRLWQTDKAECVCVCSSRVVVHTAQWYLLDPNHIAESNKSGRSPLAIASNHLVDKYYFLHIRVSNPRMLKRIEAEWRIYASVI